ncbi:hypothetical protein [Streptomyces sp. ISL-66]|uniref:hypothetical protein n=1 Tax=Streptomyces sp. ISL-66 TaxID=2819186 RepID=UPI0020353793|nr:hypothetical protein [Streptomyces sp. ISL-66]
MMRSSAGASMTASISLSVQRRTKIRRRDTTEAIIGAVTGTLTRPGLLVLGRYDAAGRLRAVGRTVPLRPDVSRQVGEHLALVSPPYRVTCATDHSGPR